MSEQRRIMKLRPYQMRALKAVIEWLNSHPSALLVAPTGAGKTEIIAAFIDRLPRGTRVLVLAHLLDLVAQTGARLASYLQGRSVTTLAASLPGKFQIEGDPARAEIVIATIDTAIDQIDDLGTFDVLVIDEAHHSIAAEYRRAVEALRSGNPKLALLGTTATPERGDRVGLEPLFGDKVASVVTMAELIRGGWLVPPRVRALPLGVIKELRDKQTDESGMRHLLNVDVVHKEVVRNWLMHGEGRPTILFGYDVEHADGMAEAFRKANIEAESVSYNTPITKRTELLREFCAGRGPKVLANPFLLTEGFDAPHVACIGLVRSFGNKSTLIQAVGRGLRLNGSKRDCLILDFAGAVEKHKGLLAGLDLKDRLKQGGGGGGGRPEGVPTVIGYGVADLLPLAVPGIPEVTFLRTPEEKEATYKHALICGQCKKAFDGSAAQTYKARKGRIVFCSPAHREQWMRKHTLNR